MLRRLAEELQGQEEAERADAEFAAERAERLKWENRERELAESVAYSLRMIDQHLSQLVHDLRMGTVQVRALK
jgi:hypothetical protein